MPSVEISILGINRVRNGLRVLGAFFPQQVDDEAYAWGEETVTHLRGRRYPAKPAGSRYVRTYKLKRGWRIKRSAKRGFRIINNAGSRSGGAYAGWVVGARQARVHQGRWWTIMEVMKERLPDLRKRLGKRITTLARTLGL